MPTRPEYPDFRHLSQPRAAQVWSVGRPWSWRNSMSSSEGASWTLQWMQSRRMSRWARTALTAAPTRKGSRPMLTSRVMEEGAWGLMHDDEVLAVARELEKRSR